MAEVNIISYRLHYNWIKTQNEMDTNTHVWLFCAKLSPNSMNTAHHGRMRTDEKKNQHAELLQKNQYQYNKRLHNVNKKANNRNSWSIKIEESPDAECTAIVLIYRKPCMCKNNDRMSEWARRQSGLEKKKQLDSVIHMQTPKSEQK